MTELGTPHAWLMRLAFALLALLILFGHLLPLNTTPSVWAMPDLLMAFALAWAVRRPEFVPILLLGAVFLLADLLLQRPPGLWAFLVLLCCERVKAQNTMLRAATFAIEWLTIAGLIVAATLAYRVTLAVLAIDLPSLPLTLIHMGLTVLCYPIVVGITHVLMRVRKATPGDLDSMGSRS